MGSVANSRRGTETAGRQELHAAPMISNCSAIDRFGLQAYLACRLRIIWIISIPAKVAVALANDLKPSIGRTRRLMRRCSCSMRLLRYRLWRMRIRFGARRERSRSRFSASHETIALRLVWLPSMTTRSGRPWRSSAFRKNRLAPAGRGVR